MFLFVSQLQKMKRPIRVADMLFVAVNIVVQDPFLSSASSVDSVFLCLIDFYVFL